MFNYPDAKPRKIIAAEQCCHKCSNWFSLTAEEVKTIEEEWRNSASFIPVKTTKCTHCGSTTILITPGKYDRPGAPKRRCAVQYLVLA